MAHASEPRPRHFDADYVEETTLADGRHVRLRLVRPEDKAMFVRGLEELSSESRYFRFFTQKPRLTDWELRYLTEVDQEQHFALGAAVVDDDGVEHGVGVARFVRFADEPDVAEAAIAVVDHCQGQGLGRLLFLRLMSAAVERGVRTFRNEVLAENKGMQHLLESIAPGLRTHPDGAAMVVDFDLPHVGADAAPSSEHARGPIYRLFRLVAERVITIRRRVLRLFGQDDDED